MATRTRAKRNTHAIVPYLPNKKNGPDIILYAEDPLTAKVDHLKVHIP